MEARPEIVEQLKPYFVTREECDRDMNDVDKKFANIATDIAVMKTKLNGIIALLGVIASGVIGCLIKLAFGG